MLTNQWLKVLVLVGALVVLLIAVWEILTLVTKEILPSGVSCLYEIIDDTNGNGQYDEGEQTMSLPNLAIEVNDPQGPGTGRYAPGDCKISPTVQDRSVHLHIIMPPGYRATSPTDIDLTVLSSTHFEDYPSHVTFFVQQTPTF